MLSKSANILVATRTVILSALSVLFLATGALAQAPAKPAPAAAVVIDQRATAIAQLLGGITPAPGIPEIDKIAASDAWLKHKEIMTAQWKKVRERLDVIEKWRDGQITLKDADKRTLLYPFSGPDFINAWAFYPKHARYMFTGLELPGTLPAMDKLGPKEIDILLRDVRNALDEIIQRNYFITSFMGKELTSPYFKGTVPIMSMMMALDGLQIVKIEPFDPFPELTKAYEEPKAAKKPGKLLRAAKIVFTAPNSNRTHELTYFSLDATDKALHLYPDFNDWLARNKPASGLVKSASYLLHDGQFSKTREMLLATADIIVQDDTGVPYRHLKQANFDVKLFGRYHTPIKPMEWAVQADLRKSFAEIADKAPLPFPFGYHWKGQDSGLMLARKQ